MTVKLKITKDRVMKTWGGEGNFYQKPRKNFCIVSELKNSNVAEVRTIDSRDKY